MAEQVRVDIDLLERATVVRLDHDYFWSVPRDQMHAFEQPPADLTIGQVTECLQWLDGVVREPDEAIAYHLAWLGDVSRAIGQEVVQ